MWLIDVQTLELKLFFGRNIPKYAILSHTWGDDEVSYQEIKERGPLSTWPPDPHRKGLQKIINTCNQAKEDSLSFAWVDTCCIDKSSSAELSEAINSMFKWYQHSVRCYAFLEDVPSSGTEAFAQSRWFTRGWTLQELLAPETVIFYTSAWMSLGTKNERSKEISEITGVPGDVIVRPGLLAWGESHFSVAQKLSWASQRETTREEDIAYCLLGLFDVNMPLLYGEGRRAFVRLQEEIFRRYHAFDVSLLTAGFFKGTLSKIRDSYTSMSGWVEISQHRHNFILADHPAHFRFCDSVIALPSLDVSPSLSGMTLKLHIPLLQAPDMLLGYTDVGDYLAILPCKDLRNRGLIAAPLEKFGDVFLRVHAEIDGNIGPICFCVSDRLLALAQPSTITIATQSPESLILSLERSRKLRMDTSSVLLSRDRFETYSWSLRGILVSGSTNFMIDKTADIGEVIAEFSTEIYQEDSFEGNPITIHYQPFLSLYAARELNAILFVFETHRPSPSVRARAVLVETHPRDNPRLFISTHADIPTAFRHSQYYLGNFGRALREDSSKAIIFDRDMEISVQLDHKSIFTNTILQLSLVASKAGDVDPQQAIDAFQITESRSSRRDEELRVLWRAAEDQ